MRKAMKGQLVRCAAMLAGVSFASVVWGQDSSADTATPDSPFKVGPYVAPMATGIYSFTKRLDYGYGGTLAGGYRLDTYAFEFSGIYDYITNSGKNTRDFGGTLNALLFPLDSAPNFFLLAGFGGREVKHYPQSTSDNLAKAITYTGGVGYLYAITAGDYEFGVRAEALYRYGHRDTKAAPNTDPDIPHTFNDVVFNLGLQLPLGKKPKPIAPAAAPVAAVPMTPPDTDGDGVPDDRDQCPNTPPGTQVNDVGCPLPPPPPPCKTPESGQRVDLSGCATGDTIVLRGVNFDFDKATLTVNAKAILDGVSDALTAAPAVKVEVGGHTDSRGSDEYNRKLSERRAATVQQYLVGRGIDAGRISSAGYGETQPIADNDTDEGREQNRRVELKVTTGSVDVGAPVKTTP